MASIPESIAILKSAQEIDGQLYLSKGRLQEIPGERAQIQQKLNAEKEQLKELEGNLKNLQLKQKEKELELNQKEGNVRKLDGQLSQVKTNKEYSALQQEIASLKADNSLLEEEIIRILDEVEALSEEKRKEAERVVQREKETAHELDELDQKEKKLSENIQRFQQQREEILAALEPDIRDRYNLIIEKKQGIGIAKIHGDICHACQMKLRPQLLNEVLLGERMVFCESCSRFLYAEQ